MEAPTGFFRNHRTPEGEQIGAMLSGMADEVAADYAVDFAKRGLPVPQRCKTCAFRKGTLANGSPFTTMTALKCVSEYTDFLCHDKDAATPCGQQVCTGWAMIVSERIKRNEPAVQMPWEHPEGVDKTA